MAIKDVTIGSNAPQQVTVVAEIPKGSHHKYEYDVETGTIRLDRVIHSPVFYPADYGFIPETLSEDGDHLDVLIIISDPTFPGCVLNVRPIGALDMSDDKGQDWKIVGVAEGDPRLSKLNDISDLDEHYRKEIEHFFREYKQLEGKQVTVNSWCEKECAYDLIKQGMQKFKQSVGK